MNRKQTALTRTEMIVKVRAGLMTAKAAAEALGAPRKTYYKWEKKGLQAMLAAERDETAGRPGTGAPPQVEALKAEVKALSAKLEKMAQTAELRFMLRMLERADAKKKAEEIPGIIAMINDLQTQSQTSAREVSHAVGLGYRTLLRWRKRVSEGKPPLTPPGPKKTGPLPLEEVRREIEALRHGRRRTRGIGALQNTYRSVISRRNLSELALEERTKRNLARRQVCKHVTWKEPNLAWAIDATEQGKDEQGQRLYVHEVQDLCTRYRFAPMVAVDSKGEAVARHLDELFHKHGAPLFLKRDNGSPLNHEAVDCVLAHHGVIPLNSPAYYPKYNGAIEKGIREMKQALGECLPEAIRWQPKRIRPYILAMHHVLNCRPRRSLQGHTACEAYQHQPRRRHNRRERLATFEWIRVHANDRVQQLEKIDHRSLNAAWRHAAETWLRCQGLITVSVNKKVLPNYPLKYAYN